MDHADLTVGRARVVRLRVYLGIAPGLDRLSERRLGAKLNLNLLQLELRPRRLRDTFQEPLGVHDVVDVTVHVHVPAPDLKRRDVRVRTRLRDLGHRVVGTHNGLVAELLVLEEVHHVLRYASHPALLQVERHPHGRRPAHTLAWLLDVALQLGVYRPGVFVVEAPVAPRRQPALRFEPGVDLNLVAPFRVRVDLQVEP